MISLKGGNYGIRSFTDSNYDLADLLQAEGRFAQAEPLLLENASYLDSRPEAKPIFERVLVERLVRFYDAWGRSAPNNGKGDQSVHWRQRLEELEGRAKQAP